jgi:hypothetical protein
MGFGSGNGLPDRLQQAAGQGAVGGAFGAAAVPVQGALQATGRYLGNLRRSVTNPLDESRVLDTLSSAMSADDLASEAARNQADELAMLAPRPPVTASGGVSRAQDAISRAARSGQPVPALVDVAQTRGGENVLRQLENAGMQPGRARTLIASESQRRAEQIVPTLDQALEDATQGTARRSETLNALQQRQRTQADDLYSQINDVPVQMSARLGQLSVMPAVQRGIAAALEAAGNVLDPNMRRAYSFITQGDDGVYRVMDGAPVRTWDLIKRGMDDDLYRSQRDAEGLTRFGRDRAREVSRATVREIDSILSPTGRPDDSAYAAARSAFAGEQAVQEAFEFGQQVLRTGEGHSEFMDAVATMNPSQREGLVAGAREALQAMIGEARATPSVVNRVLDRRDVEARIVAVLGDEGGRLIRQMRLMRERSAAIGAISSRSGSQTAARMIEDANQPGQMAMSTPNPMSALGSWVQDLATRGGRLTARENERLVQYGINPNLVYRAIGQTRAYQAYRQAGYPQSEAGRLALQWTGSGVPNVPPYQPSMGSVAARNIRPGAVFVAQNAFTDLAGDE